MVPSEREVVLADRLFHPGSPAPDRVRRRRHRSRSAQLRSLRIFRGAPLVDEFHSARILPRRAMANRSRKSSKQPLAGQPGVGGGARGARDSEEEDFPSLGRGGVSRRIWSMAWVVSPIDNSPTNAEIVKPDPPII